VLQQYALVCAASLVSHDLTVRAGQRVDVETAPRISIIYQLKCSDAPSTACP